MAAHQEQIPTYILDDLCSRFIINVPVDQRDDPVRIFFAVELAFWFYLDFYLNHDSDSHECKIENFAKQIFQHCPFLRGHVPNLNEIIVNWRNFKYSVPTYGAILIDPTYQFVLLVRGFHFRESWGFPKGKVQENENPLKCAIREVMEEVGFDIKDRVCANQYLEKVINGQIIRLFIVEGVSLDTKFVPKTKNEIKDMRWFSIACLPNDRRDQRSKIKLNLGPKAFFTVIPFMKDLRQWIWQRYYSMPCIDLNESNKNSKFNCLDKKHKGRRRAESVSNSENATVNHDTLIQQQKQLPSQKKIQTHLSQTNKNVLTIINDNKSNIGNRATSENSFVSGNSKIKLPISYNNENRQQPSFKSSSENRPLSALEFRHRASCRVGHDVIIDGANTLNHTSNHHRHKNTDTNRKDETFSNLMNETFGFNGPKCWQNFSLDRSEVLRCLDNQ